jgi:hypothetical protein
MESTVDHERSSYCKPVYSIGNCELDLRVGCRGVGRETAPAGSPALSSQGS